MKLNNIIGWSVNDHEFLAQTQEGILGLSFAGPDTFRLRFNRGEKLRSEETFVVLQSPEKLSFDVEEYSDLLDGSFTGDIHRHPEKTVWAAIIHLKRQFCAWNAGP